MKLTREKVIKTREVTMKGVFLLSSIFSIFALISIVGFLLYSSLPAFREIGFFKILFGKFWHPDTEKFGIMPFILGSLYTTIMAILIGVPLGLFTAIFLYKFCHKKLAGIIRQMINLLAGLPSVVFGMFGLLFVVPYLRRISPTGIGEGILAASLVLSIMILPTIVNISLNALHAVPKTIYEGALALGATKEQAVFKVVLPAAKNGVFASVVLAIGRAIGEAMAVSMVIGLNGNIPESLFMPASTMASVLASEGGGAFALHMEALFAIGAVLFLFALFLNAIFALVRDRKTKGKDKAKSKKSMLRLPNFKFGYSKTTNRILRIISYITTAVSIFALLGIMIGIFIQGLPHISLHFIFGKYSANSPTLDTALVGTLYLILISLPIAVLIGVATAIFLAEYASKSRLIRYIKIAIETLAGIPSIVYGLFGYAMFVVAFGMGRSLVGGGLTLSIMLLPIIVRTVEESLLAVPISLREGAYALGTGKVRTIFKIVLPSALSGIVSSIILAVGRVISETSMLILTIGMVTNIMPAGIEKSGTSISLNVYYFFQGGNLDLAAATCVVLFVLVTAINLVATLLGKLLTKVKGQE